LAPAAQVGSPYDREIAAGRLRRAMSIVIEFTVPADSCALGRSLGSDPNALLELDRIVPTDDSVMPFFWVWGRDAETFAAAARTEPAIDRIAVVDRVDGGALLAAEWNPDAAGTLRSIAEADGTLLDAHATNTEWRFEVRFADAAATSEFRRLCRERGVPLALARVTTSPESPDHRYGLTPEQREALVVAYGMGFFEEPRRATLADVADELGISPRAVTGRLRRGQSALLEHTGVLARSHAGDRREAAGTRGI
jgi:predicted DNA binding protein